MSLGVSSFGYRLSVIGHRSLHHVAKCASSSGKRNRNPVASSRAGTRRALASMASFAASLPNTSRSAAGGTGINAGRDSTRPQRAGELGIGDGMRRDHVDRPERSVRLEGEPE